VETDHALDSLFGRIFYGKPVSTFPENALIGFLIESTQNQLSRAVPVPGGAERNGKRRPGTQNEKFFMPVPLPGQ
jgi:hypothetical protein